MKVLNNPSQQELKLNLARPVLQADNLETLMEEIFVEVKENGDSALKQFIERFDKVSLETLEVSPEEWKEAENLISSELKSAIKTAARNIGRFHASQICREHEVETSEGVFCWRKAVGIQNVGLYIPGGTAPLFSTVLMLGIPAKIAGCVNRILCTPAMKNGKINPAILFAAQIAGITRIFKVGGAQAIAALSLGTESIPKVDKVFGPGNQYVTAAKVYAQRFGMAIDMPAGPSEVLVAADDSVRASFIAADLLAQAEHGVDSQVVFLTDSFSFAEQVQTELAIQWKDLPRAEIAKQALENSVAVIVKVEDWAGIINAYAPEHLIVMGKYENLIVANVVNAGSVFIGQYTAESFGDYASGTNHTLPTAGYARSYSGVSLDSFVKKITYQRVTERGLLNLGKTVVTMAEAEELHGHANAVTIRYISLRRTLSMTAGSFSGKSGYQTLLPQDSETVNSVVRLSVRNEVEDVSNSTIGIERFIRSDLRNVKPYSSARDEFVGTGEVFLDANENGLLTEYNRYPDPLQKELKQAISKVKNIPVKNLFLGNGSDEVLDLIFRLTATPFLDSVAYLNPSYGMYAVLAKINGLRTVEINLDKELQVSVEVILQGVEGSRILVLCNPNNPTGGIIQKEDLLEIVRRFRGIVVVDEAYIDFCPEFSLAAEVENYANLIVVQTLSKAFGMAGLRIGMAIASKEWVDALNTIKPPYNLSSLVQKTAVDVLNSTNWENVKQTIVSEKKRLVKFLNNCKSVEKVFSSQANFILFKTQNANEVYEKLIEKGVVVRNRITQFNCENSLRVSIGSVDENNCFIEIMKSL
jgi:histidinol dehydrogenase